MRLDPIEKEALDHALQNVKGEVFLFGSRVDHSKKGGDIDILIFSPESPFHLSRKVSVMFKMECDEKIDVIVMNPQKMTEEQQAFLNTLVLEKIK